MENIDKTTEENKTPLPVKEKPVYFTQIKSADGYRGKPRKKGYTKYIGIGLFVTLLILVMAPRILKAIF
jgi:hypothetical protein